MGEAWTIEATRDCPNCRGSGENLELQKRARGPGQTEYRQTPPSAACPACKGSGNERKLLTLAELRAALAEV
jgi:DnaJ-class molecular chaperone